MCSSFYSSDEASILSEFLFSLLLRRLVSGLSRRFLYQLDFNSLYLYDLLCHIDFNKFLWLFWDLFRVFEPLRA